jgi:type IV pilus assembly protein PilB
MSEPIRKMLRERTNANEIRKQAISEGMMTMKQDGITKAIEGITSITEVVRNIFTIT